MPLAYAEHDTTNGLYPPESVLTPERLKATADSFNPELFSPPILSAPSGSMGEVHRTATKGGGDKLGELDKLDFDGTTLWGKGSEIADRCGSCRGTGKLGAAAAPIKCARCQGSGYVGRLSDAVSRGHTKRSVHVLLNNKLFGGQPTLHHLAVGSTDPEGQLALPPLSHYLKGTLGADTAAARSFDEGPFTARALPDDEPAPHQEQEERMPLTQEEITAIGETFRSMVETTVVAAVTPLKATIETQAAALADAGKKADEAVAASRALAAAAEEGAIRSRLTGAQSAGKLLPADFDGELATARALTGEVREAHLKRIETRSALLPERRTLWGGESANEGNDLRLLGPFEGAALSGDLDPDATEAYIAAARALPDAVKADINKPENQRALIAEYKRQNPIPPWLSGKEN